MKTETGLRRALSEGDAVILSTGATATVRRAYPAGYFGDVEILLNGVGETERTQGLTLPDEQPLLGGAEAAESTETPPTGEGETRAPKRRMQD